MESTPPTHCSLNHQRLKIPEPGTYSSYISFLMRHQRHCRICHLSYVKIQYKSADILLGLLFLLACGYEVGSFSSCLLRVQYMSLALLTSLCRGDASLRLQIHSIDLLVSLKSRYRVLGQRFADTCKGPRGDSTIGGWISSLLARWTPTCVAVVKGMRP